MEKCSIKGYFKQSFTKIRVISVTREVIFLRINLNKCMILADCTSASNWIIFIRGEVT